MNVLILDDDPVNVSILKLLVDELGGNESHCFTSSSRALAWCEGYEVDLAIVDYMIEAPNGVDFIRAFRQMKGRDGIPVVMVTANRRKKVRYEALEAGANDFLDKPIDRIEFQARIRNMLAWRASQKLLASQVAWLGREIRRDTGRGASAGNPHPPCELCGCQVKVAANQAVSGT